MKHSQRGLYRIELLIFAAVLILPILACILVFVHARRGNQSDGISISQEINDETTDAMECNFGLTVENGKLTARRKDPPHEVMGRLERFDDVSPNVVAMFMGSTSVVNIDQCIGKAGLQSHVRDVPLYRKPSPPAT